MKKLGGDRQDFSVEFGIPSRERKIFHGWFLFGLGAFIAALGDTPFYRGLPIWNPVLRNAFGWSTVEMSWAYAITQVPGAERSEIGPLFVAIPRQRLVPEKI